MLRHNVIACARDTREGIRKPRQLSAGRTGPFPPVPIGPIGQSSSGADPQRPSNNAIGSANTPVIVASGRFNNAESSSQGSSLGGLPLGSGNETGGGRAPIGDEPGPNTSSSFDSEPDLSSNRVTDAVYRRAVKGSSVEGSGVSDMPLESLRSNESESCGESLVSHSTMSDGRGPGGEVDSSGSPSVQPLCVADLDPESKRGSTSVRPCAVDDTENSEAGKSSGRELLCHRDDSKEAAMLFPLPSSEGKIRADGEEHGEDRSAVVVGEEEVKGVNKPLFGLFRSRPPVESDFPRRSSSGSARFVNTAGEAATGTLSAPLCFIKGDQSEEEGLPSSGKTLLYHRNNSVEEKYYFSASHLPEEKDDDDNGNVTADGVDIDSDDSSAGRDEREGSSRGKSSFRLFRPSAPVESDVPRRRPISHVGYVDGLDEAAVDDHPLVVQPEDNDFPSGDSTASGKQLLCHRSLSGEDGKDAERPLAGAARDCAGDPLEAGGDGAGDSYGVRVLEARKPYSGLLGGKMFAGGKRSRQECSTESECVDTDANSDNGNLAKGQAAQGDGSGDLSGISREKIRGGELLLAPWSSRKPTAIDMPRRRSLVSSGWQPPQSMSGANEPRSLPVDVGGMNASLQEEQKVSVAGDEQESLVYESGRRLLSENSISSMEPGEERPGRVSPHPSIGSTPAEWTSGRSGFGLFSNRHPEYAPRRGSMHFADPVDTSTDGVLVPVQPTQVEARVESGSGPGGEGFQHRRHHSEGGQNTSTASPRRGARETGNDSDGNGAAALTTNNRNPERGSYLSMFRSTMPEIDGELAESEFLQIRSSGRSLFSAWKPRADDLPRRRSIDTSDRRSPIVGSTFTRTSGDQVTSESHAHDTAMGISGRQQEEKTEREKNTQDSRLMPVKGVAETSSRGSVAGIRWGLGRSMMIDESRRRAPISASSVESSSRSAGTGTGSSSRSVESNTMLDLFGKRGGPPQTEDTDDNIGREGIFPVQTTDGNGDAIVGSSGGSLLGGVGWKKKPKLAVNDTPRRRMSSSGTALILAPDDNIRTPENGTDRDEVGR